MLTTASRPRTAPSARPAQGASPAKGGLLKNKAGSFYRPKPVSKTQKNANTLGEVIRGKK